MKGDPNVGRSSSSSAIKKREKPSKVWKEMRKYTDEYENEMAECIHCKATFDASSKIGTTHLKRHLESKKCQAKRQKGPGPGGPGGRDGDYQVQSLSPSIKAKELASLIKEKPLRDLIRHFSNREGDTSGKEQPEFPSYGLEVLDASVLNSMKDEILQLYQEEKEKLCQFLKNLSCRFCLQIVYHFDGCFFVVHYIDDSWERQSKIIGYRQDARNDAKDLIEAVKQSCLDWEIDGKICSLLFPLRICRADDDGKQIGEMANWFSQRGSPPLPCFIRDNDTFMHNIQYILGSENYAKDVIPSIRKCAEYVFCKLTSDKSSFYAALRNSPYDINRNVPLSDKSSVSGAVDSALDELQFDPFRGDIFRYFELAVRFKEAFFILQNFDSGFRSINLTEQKWEEVTDTFEHLKFLSGVDCSLLERQCEIPITVDISYVGVMLNDRFKHPRKSCLFCKKVVKRAIDLYFREDYLLRVIAVILDPRFKMDGVQLHFNEIYGSDADRYVEKVNKDFRKVYDAYAATDSSNSKSYEMLDAMGRRSSPKSELDRYFNLLIPRDKQFDILAWWRGNAPSYPTLARMARDYLVSFDYKGGHLMDDITFIDFKGEAAREIASPLVCLKGFFGYR